VSGDRVQARTQRELQITDSMTRELRECVHEFGLPIVERLMWHGVTSPGAIREIVREVWDGARQPSQRLYGAAGASVVNKLDWVLIQANCPISAKRLIRVLADRSYTITPSHPTAAMINASLSALHNHGLVSKHEKHRLRLIAALKAAQKELSEGASLTGSGRSLADATQNKTQRIRHEP
jgi:hypothetical protein